MCNMCWESAGSPKIINERTQKAAELIEALYDTEQGGAGGYAHIVVDDFNIDDQSIDWCLRNMHGNVCQETKDASIECLRYLRTLNEEERWSALAIHNGY